MRLHALLLAALGSLAGALPATAGNFTVSPVRILRGAGDAVPSSVDWGGCELRGNG